MIKIIFLRAMKCCRLICIATIVWVLSGCYGAPIVPVSDLSPGQVSKYRHTVQNGDTLYSIAFAAGLDFHDLAGWNKVQSPFVIYPGQNLRLTKPKNYQEVATVIPLESTTAGAPESMVTKQPLEPNNSSTSSISKPDTAGVVTKPPQPSPTPTNAPRLLPTQIEHWSWPAKGKLVQKYSLNQGSKGIDIAGKAGTPVKAAAPGRVVYAGEGLRGYGQLVILQHNDTYLSAYAHHRRLMVKEGDMVTQGQTIGEMGNSGTDEVKLHFEIRRRGDPIDPLKLLPRTNA